VADRLRLAVSNIAWDVEDDAAIAAMLVNEGVGGIEIAPTKWRERPIEASVRDVSDYRMLWKDRGLPIVAMQSLLFGQPQLQLFGDKAGRTAMLEYLKRMVDLGAALGARALVFGSPKNRLRGALSDEEMTAIALPFLREIGSHAESSGVAFCLEPVPARYGSDWVLTPADAVAMAQQVEVPGLCVNGDLGAMLLAGADPASCIRDAGATMAHYHASEPDFVNLNDAPAHLAAAEGLSAIAYRGWISIEMARGGDVDRTESMRAAVRLARAAYGVVLGEWNSMSS
jgi:D-psicose/D-tagatose/L-ribulose 3-epimerase